MTALNTTSEIEGELDAIEKIDCEQSDAAWLLLQELYDNRDLLSDLKAPEFCYGHVPLFEFKAFEEAMRLGYRIYILKFYEPEHGALCDYRILLGYHSDNDVYYALAICPRKTAYLTNHPGFTELCRRYEFYGIPRIPRIP
jgi:hypothetical protein